MSEIKPFTGIDDRVLLNSVLPLDTPFTLNLFPSNLCNFRCNYCAQSLGAEKMNEIYGLKQEMMSLETVERVIVQAKQFPHRLKLVSMMGHGEPLCNRKLPQMIRMIKSAGIADRVDIITNGSLLTPELSDELIEAGLDVLRVSLQGITADMYEKICSVKINYEKFMDSLSYFYHHKKRCRVYVKTMDAALEAGREEEFFQMFKDKSDRMYIDKVMPVYDAVEYSESERDLSVDRYGNHHAKRLVCPQPFYMMSVWADGETAPCDALYKACPLGNVRETNLLSMWRSEKRRQFCHSMLCGEKDQMEPCIRCCAPDDVQNEMDVLDDEREKLIKYFVW